jgi:hypothetical protein
MIYTSFTGSEHPFDQLLGLVSINHLRFILALVKYRSSEFCHLIKAENESQDDHKIEIRLLVK